MTRQHNDQDRPAGIPLSAVYRQLDDHPVPGADQYSATAAVARMMEKWIGDGLTTPQAGAADIPVTAETVPGRHELVKHLVRRRMVSAMAAIAVVLGICGIAAAVATALARHTATPVLAGIGVTAVLLASAVVRIHQVTMRTIVQDHSWLLSQDGTASGHADPAAAQTDSPVPRKEKPVRAIARYEDDELAGPPRYRPASTAVLAIAAATYFGLHAGIAGVFVIAVAAGILLLSVFMVIATVLFGGEERSARALSLVRMVIHSQSPLEVARMLPRRTGLGPRGREWRE